MNHAGGRVGRCVAALTRVAIKSQVWPRPVLQLGPQSLSGYWLNGIGSRRREAVGSATAANPGPRYDQ